METRSFLVKNQNFPKNEFPCNKNIGFQKTCSFLITIMVFPKNQHLPCGNVTFQKTSSSLVKNIISQQTYSFLRKNVVFESRLFPCKKYGFPPKSVLVKNMVCPKNKQFRYVIFGFSKKPSVSV